MIDDIISFLDPQSQVAIIANMKKIKDDFCASLKLWWMVFLTSDISKTSDNLDQNNYRTLNSRQIPFKAYNKFRKFLWITELWNLSSLKTMTLKL